MAIIESTETQLNRNPRKFAAAEQPTKLLKRINGEPPINAGRGKRRSPVISAIYGELLQNRNVWFHIELPIMKHKHLAALRASLYSRASKDNLRTQTSSVFNDTTKMFDVWIMLTN